MSLCCTASRPINYTPTRYNCRRRRCEAPISRPPTEWYNVADRHAVATNHQGGHGGEDPTTMPMLAYDCEYNSEANNFGEDLVRMAGIVQMLHAHNSRYDKYLSHAHRTRTLTSRARDQARRTATVSLTVPGPCHTVLAMCHNKEHPGLLTCSIWLIQSILLNYKFRP